MSPLYYAVGASVSFDGTKIQHFFQICKFVEDFSLRSASFVHILAQNTIFSHRKALFCCKNLQMSFIFRIFAVTMKIIGF